MSDSQNITIPTLLVGGFVIALLIILVIVGIIFIEGYTFVKNDIVEPIVTTPTPQIIYVENIPSTISFTVMKANAAQPNSVNGLDREYSVLTTDGDILVLANYYSWDALELRQSYTCNVGSALTNYGRQVYSVSGCYAYRYINYYQNYDNTNDHWYNDKYHDYNRNTGKYNDHIEYYYYNKQYWRCVDDGNCKSVNRDSIPDYVTIHYQNPF